MKHTRWVLAFSVLLMVALDQAVKQWARVYLLPVGRIPLIEGWLGLRWATNTGAAFGILQGGRWFFIAVTIVVIGAVLVYEFKFPYTSMYMWVRIPLALILAGGIGNFIDRMLFGYVVDMFEFLFINFPIFNVADIFLVLGTLGYMFAVLFILKEEHVSSE